MPRAQPRARRPARGPRGGSPNACSFRSSVHSFHGFLLPNELLDDAARSRPVLHDVATRQVRHTRVAVMKLSGTPTTTHTPPGCPSENSLANTGRPSYASTPSWIDTCQAIFKA